SHSFSPTTPPTTDIYTLSLHDALPIFVLEDQTTVHISDAKAHPSFQNARVVRMTNARTVLGVPMMREEGVIGGMVLARYTVRPLDRKSTRLNSSHLVISYAVFCLKKKK